MHFLFSAVHTRTLIELRTSQHVVAQSSEKTERSISHHQETIQKQIVEVIRQERPQQRTVEQLVDAPVPQVQEKFCSRTGNRAGSSRTSSRGADPGASCRGYKDDPTGALARHCCFPPGHRHFGARDRSWKTGFTACGFNKRPKHQQRVVTKSHGEQLVFSRGDKSSHFQTWLHFMHAKAYLKPRTKKHSRTNAQFDKPSSTFYQ